MKARPNLKQELWESVLVILYMSIVPVLIILAFTFGKT